MRRVPFLLLAAAGIAASAGGQSAAPAKAAVPAPPPLFADSVPLSLVIRADLPTVFNDRDSTKRRRHPATLTLGDSGEAQVSLPVELSTRGHFRRKHSTCTVPPIRVRFHRESSKGTPFAGQRSLKVVTHCRPRAEYESYVLEEYLIYRVLNVLTDTSFRVRLARVTWTSTRDRNHADTRWAFFIEDEAALARRLGGRLLEQRGARADDFPAEHIDFVSLFEYFIGNTDWSLAGLHNIRLLALGRPDEAPRYAVVPYDFDFSGVVSARYALPDYRLPIRTVAERLYRGPCRTPEQMAPAVERLRRALPAIRELYETSALANNRRRRALDYYYAFFRITADAGGFASELSRSCERPGGGR